MKTNTYQHSIPASIVLFAASNPSGQLPEKEEKDPVEPVSEKDEVKKAEEKTRDAQKEVDDHKKQDTK